MNRPPRPLRHLSERSQLASAPQYAARMSRSDQTWPADPAERRAVVAQRIRLMMFCAAVLVLGGIAASALGSHKLGVALVGFGVAAVIALIVMRRSLHLIGQTSDDLPR